MFLRLQSKWTWLFMNRHTTGCYRFHHFFLHLFLAFQSVSESWGEPRELGVTPINAANNAAWLQPTNIHFRFDQKVNRTGLFKSTWDHDKKKVQKLQAEKRTAEGELYQEPGAQKLRGSCWSIALSQYLHSWWSKERSSSSVWRSIQVWIFLTLNKAVSIKVWMEIPSQNTPPPQSPKPCRRSKMNWPDETLK